MPQTATSALPDDPPFALSLRRVNRGVGYVALMSFGLSRMIKGRFIKAFDDSGAH